MNNWIYTSLVDGVFTITLNRPEKRNAITVEMMRLITKELHRTGLDDNVRVLVLTGCEYYYSSGNDFTPSNIDVIEGLFAFQHLVDTMIEYPKLLVAVVNGPAIGMACTTLALCDVVYASQFSFFQTPFTRMGLVAEACSTVTFPRIFGMAKAANLLYLNELMSVTEAFEAGFISGFFPPHLLYQEAYARIRELASYSLEALVLTKQLIRKWDRQLLHDTNAQEVECLKKRIKSPDFLNALLNTKPFRSKL